MINYQENYRPADRLGSFAGRRSRLRILLAEDNPLHQRLTTRLLKMAGHSVVVAGDGQQALDALEQHPFDVVLMDVEMPVIDGFEATARIRRWERGSRRRLPIIAVTAHALWGDRERCLQVGMDGYVPKPIESESLFEALSTATLGLDRAEIGPACSSRGPWIYTPQQQRQAETDSLPALEEFLQPSGFPDDGFGMALIPNGGDLRRMSLQS
jgi:CheY-like chemotaxis protein